MKWNTLLATLVLSFVCSQTYAAGLLDTMLGTGCGVDTSCCQTPKCCTPKPRCCLPKARCHVPVAATCAAPEPACCAPEVACQPSCCGTPSWYHATPLRDALSNLFACRKSHCHSSCGCAVEASCAAPEATCAAPVACGCEAAPSCCKVRSCTPLRDAISRLFCCHNTCSHSCGCDTGCGADCGCGSTYSAPVEASPSEADMMPPAPVPADTMTFVPANRRLARAR